MSTTIAKTSIGISANATEAISEMERLSNKSKALENSVKTLPQVGEKARAAFSQIGAVGSVFSTMASDANILEKTIGGISGAVSVMTVALQLATTVTKGLKAALLSSGIGAIVIGLGYLASRLSSSGGGGGGGGGERPTEAPIVGMTRRMREGATGGRTADEVGLTAATEDLARMVTRRRELIWDTSEAAVRVHADLGTRIDTARPMVRRAVEAGETGRGTARLADLEGEITRSRDMAATLGMSAEAADEYSLSLRRTTRMIDGVRVATTEALGPAEAHARRLEEFAAIERRTGVDMTRARAESMAMMGREVASIDRLRAARLAADSARERERVVRPDESRAREIERMSSLFRRGGTDIETFRRGIASVSGVDLSVDMSGTFGDMTTLRSEVGRLTGSIGGIAPAFGGIGPALRGVAPVLGGISPLLGGIVGAIGGIAPAFGGIGPALRGVAPVLGGISPLLGGIVGAIGGIAPASEIAGGAVASRFTGPSITALIAARTRIDAVRDGFGAIAMEATLMGESLPDMSPFVRALEGIAGDTRTPLESTRDRIAEIGMAWEEAGTLAGLAGTEFDDTSFRRATATALSGLIARGSVTIAAPQALLEGSASALSAINAARRAGSDDPAERSARSLEFVRRSTEAAERHGAELVRLLGEGRITL